MIKVLFVCIHNSARSQMAEELLRREMPAEIEVSSAGLEPGQLNPIVVELLSEIGIDIQGKATRSVFDIFRSGKSFNYVITVCDESSGERCPIFPGAVKRLHWSFPDPSALDGDRETKKAETREIMLIIEAKIKDFTAELRKILAS